MTTITLTKENFWKKVSLLYDKIIATGKVRIRLEDTDTKELAWTSHEEDAYLQAAEDFKSGKITKIDLKDIKTEDEFISLIQS